MKCLAHEEEPASDDGLERLRAAIAKGEAGEEISWTPGLMDEISREAEARRWRGEQPNPDVCP